MRKVIESKTTREYFRQVKDDYLSLFSNAEWQVLIESLETSMGVWETQIGMGNLETGVWVKLQGIKQRIQSIQ